MFKKLLGSIATAVVLMNGNHAFAQPGPYIGAALGGNQGSWYVQDNTGSKFGVSTRGVIGTLFAGFAFNPQPFYIGFEGFANQTSNRSGSRIINSGTVSRYVRQSYSYGGSILPGVSYWDCAAVYLRGGMTRTRFQVTDRVIASGVRTSNSPYLTGTHLGAGAQVAISGCLDARLEYIYTMYNSFSNINGKFSPRNNQINLGLLYRLG